MKNTTWIVTEKTTTETRATLTLRSTDWYFASVAAGEDEDDLDARWEVTPANPGADGADVDRSDDGMVTISMDPAEAAGIEPGQHFVFRAELVIPKPTLVTADA